MAKPTKEPIEGEAEEGTEAEEADGQSEATPENGPVAEGASSVRRDGNGALIIN